MKKAIITLLAIALYFHTVIGMRREMLTLSDIESGSLAIALQNKKKNERQHRIINRLKKENKELQAKIETLSSLNESLEKSTLEAGKVSWKTYVAHGVNTLVSVGTGILTTYLATHKTMANTPSALNETAAVYWP